MIKKIFLFIKNKPGLLILTLFLLTISITTLKPDFYLVGWDNYSSYFNLKTNIFRTLFATWREYRGLGVPSDSEVTDIFRQLFYLALKPIIKETLLEQLYIVFALNLGTISMYVFATILFQKIFKKTNSYSADIFAFFVSFFYLFNLSTLSIFYFPMIMFINRFFTIPLTLLCFLLLHGKKNLTISQKILIIIALLVASGTYLVATNFITILLLLGIFTIFQQNIKKSIIIGVFFILLNSFWLLPFINYTVHKAKIIRLAPTFIEANETQLNKPKSFYDLQKQLILYPNFFETQFSIENTNAHKRFHPLGQETAAFPANVILLIFPALYSIGSVLIFIQYKKLKKILWIPITLLLFLFLTLKEFSPLGFVYNFFDQLNPLFGVLFRFGDTKFHAFIAFSGSLAAGLALAYLYAYIKRFTKIFLTLLFIVVVIPTTLVFSQYFKGNLIGFYIYNHIPDAYFKIAQTINQDPDNVRVLHLPFDNKGYWKSYTWGMIGSSFLNFMIDKPLIDRTFEPASEENVKLHRKLSELLRNAQSISSSALLDQRAQKLYNTLQQTGVKYIVLDETVTPEVKSRGIILWGKFNGRESKLLTDRLISLNLAKIVKIYSTKSFSYSSSFSKKPLTETWNVALLELQNPQPKISFTPHIEFISSTIKELIGQPTVLAQSPQQNDYVNFPLLQNNRIIFNDYSLTIPSNQLSEKKSYAMNTTVPSTTEVANYIEVTGRKDEQNLILNFYLHYFPPTQNTSFRKKIKELLTPLPSTKPSQFTTNSANYMSDWSLLPYEKFGYLRLQIGDYIIPLPENFSNNEQGIAHVVTHGVNPEIKLFNYNNTATLDLNMVTLTERSNCFNDKLQDYSYQMIANNQLQITSQNGSTCFFADLKNFFDTQTSYIELALSIEGNNTDLDSAYNLNFQQTSKPELKKVITNLPKPNFLYICVKEPQANKCYNIHQNLQVPTQAASILIPLEKSLNKITDVLLFASIKNVNYQKQNIQINNIDIIQFSTLQSDILSIPEASRVQTEATSSKLSFKASLPLSAYSFYQTKYDGWQVSNGLCDNPEGYRTFRYLPDGNLVGYLEDCYNQFFQPADFSSENFYIWKVDYNLLSGQFPQFLLEDGFNHYVNEYLSLYQEYPDIPGFKQFQVPEIFPQNTRAIEKKLIELNYQTAFTYVTSQSELNDTKSKRFTVHQYSENEGIVALNSMNIIELPAYWQSFTMSPNTTQKNYAIPTNVQYEQIFPSLWKITLEAPLSSLPSLLYFNEAFDAQWKPFSSYLNMMFGKTYQYKHYKCNTYANCFELTIDKPTTLYLLYTPEMLNFLGILIALTSLLSFVFIKRKNSRTES